MMYSCEITMTYLGISPNIDGSLVRTVNVDLKNVKQSVNNENGRPIKLISGELSITGDDYKAFAVYLNDSAGYYIDTDYYSYKLYRNGTQMETGSIILTKHDYDNKELHFRLYDEVVNGYKNIYDDWETEYNIISGVSTTANITTYTDFRTIGTKATTETNVTLGSQAALNTYIDLKVNEDELWIAVSLTFTAKAAHVFDIVTNWEILQAYGYYNGTETMKPSGINWVYDADYSGYPLFRKKPRHIYTTYPVYTGVLAPSACVIETEQLSNINYPTRARSFNEIIDYLIDKADSTIGFDSSVFDNFYSVTSSHSFNSSTRPLNYIKVIGLSDFLPTNTGILKTNKATVCNMSFKMINDWLESIGAYWYLENITGVNYFRLSHITKKVLTTNNPDLIDYKNRNWMTQKHLIEIEDNAFDKVQNTTQSTGADFFLKEFKYRAGSNAKSFESSNIITDLNYIIDAKTDVFSDNDLNQWVFCSTTKDLSSPYYFEVRKVTSDFTGLSTNNYELSFHWIANNLMAMPGKYPDDAAAAVADNRILKRNLVEFKLPFDDFFNGFSIHDYIVYNVNGANVNAEIDSMEKNLLDNAGTLKIKY